jgi:AmmeMemoRadiSam system protein A
MSMLTAGQQQELLGIARAALIAELCRQPAPVIDLAGVAGRPAGAFVTLHRRGELRGCIGQIEAAEPVGRVIARCAVSAARSDYRFSPVTASELAELGIEVSILSPLERVDVFDTIEIGKHGLIVEMDSRRGLLLPQVAVEWQWERVTFLEQTCRKAGLARDAWKCGATIWKFEAEVFSEMRDS